MGKSIKAKGTHLGKSLIRGPMLERDAIGCDHYTGSILSKFTVNENSRSSRIVEDLKKMGEVRVSGIGKPADGDAEKMHAESFRADALQIGSCGSLSTKVNDGGNAKLFQFE